MLHVALQSGKTDAARDRDIRVVGSRWNDRIQVEALQELIRPARRSRKCVNVSGVAGKDPVNLSQGVSHGLTNLVLPDRGDRLRKLAPNAIG